MASVGATVGAVAYLRGDVLDGTPPDGRHRRLSLLPAGDGAGRGSPPGVGRALLCWWWGCMQYIAMVPFFASFLPILFDRRRRAIQDMLAGTAVAWIKPHEASRGRVPWLPTCPPPPPPDPAQLLRSRSYTVVLVFGAILGVPVAAVAYFFLKLVAEAQPGSSRPCPATSGSTASRPGGRSLPLTVSGLLVALTIRYLPGTGGHKPAEGFKASGAGRCRSSCPASSWRRSPRSAFGVGARPRGAADRHRQRAGRAARSTWSSGTRPRGGRRDRRRRELRRDQHAARLAARRARSC